MVIFRLFSPEVVINNESIDVVPSTDIYTEGFGENLVSPHTNVIEISDRLKKKNKPSLKLRGKNDK